MPAQRPPEIETLFRAVKTALWAIGGFSLVYNLLVLAVPIYTLQLFDRVLSSRSMDTLALLTVITFALLAVQGAVDWVRGAAMRRIATRLDISLSAPLLRHAVLASAAGKPEANQSLQDLTEVRNQLASPSIFALFDAPWAPVFIAILFLMHPYLGVFGLVGALLLGGLAIANLYLAKRPQDDESARIIADSRQVNDYVRNAEAIQAMGMLGAVQRRWQAQSAVTLWLQGKVTGKLGGITAFTKFARLCMQVGIMGVAVILVLAGELTPGAMIAASIIMARAVSPFEQAVGAWKGWNSALAAWRRLVAAMTEPAPTPTTVALPTPDGAVTVSGVTYAPPGGGAPILKKLSFGLESGDVVGVIGPSGAGKTTLARLLVGAIKPTLGEIRLDDANLSEWDREDIGQYIGYLPQDVQLFSGTVRENISRFREDADDAAVLAAARSADVHEMILRLPEAYDTRIGEGGFPISGGQRQRIALARALFGAPKLVVLDEPNSHLDSAGDKALFAALVHLREEAVTTLAITHRSSLLRAVDRLIILRDGELEMIGPRDDVLAALNAPQKPVMEAQAGQGALGAQGGAE